MPILDISHGGKIAQISQDRPNASLIIQTLEPCQRFLVLLPRSLILDRRPNCAIMIGVSAPAARYD